MTLLSRAMIFANRVHDGQVRKGCRIPYILHPMETAAIAATMTEDEETLAAAVLHDVVEDGAVTEKALAEEFGERVARLVACETQTCEGHPEATWVMRKQGKLDQIAEGDEAVQIIALSDKLSNMRAIHRDYVQHGEKLFDRFHRKEKQMHAWYYQSCATLLKKTLADTEAWQELNGHIQSVFGGEGEPKEQD